MVAQRKAPHNLVKGHLKRQGITQAWLAKEQGMSFGITSNHKHSTTATLFKAAAILGVSQKN